MILTLIIVFTFRFHSSSRDNRPGFQLEYSTLNCGDGTNNVCNIGISDNDVNLIKVISLGRETVFCVLHNLGILRVGIWAGSIMVKFLQNYKTLEMILFCSFVEKKLF